MTNYVADETRAKSSTECIREEAPGSASFDFAYNELLIFTGNVLPRIC